MFKRLSLITAALLMGMQLARAGDCASVEIPLAGGKSGWSGLRLEPKAPDPDLEQEAAWNAKGPDGFACEIDQSATAYTYHCVSQSSDLEAIKAAVEEANALWDECLDNTWKRETNRDANDRGIKISHYYEHSSEDLAMSVDSYESKNNRPHRLTLWYYVRR